MKKIPRSRKSTESDEKTLWRHAQPSYKEKINSLGGVIQGRQAKPIKSWSEDDEKQIILFCWGRILWDTHLNNQTAVKSSKMRWLFYFCNGILNLTHHCMETWRGSGTRVTSSCPSVLLHVTLHFYYITECTSLDSRFLTLFPCALWSVWAQDAGPDSSGCVRQQHRRLIISILWFVTWSSLLRGCTELRGLQPEQCVSLKQSRGIGQCFWSDRRTNTLTSDFPGFSVH